MNEQNYNIFEGNQEIDDGQNIFRLHKKKINQLRNKAFFFEGQINPLFDENQKLKQQIVELNRIVISSTQKLRNLLPTNNDPNRKLKLAMASLQQISKMIQQDWTEMKISILSYQKLIENLNQQLSSLKILYDNTVLNYNNQIKTIHSEKQRARQSFNQQIQSLQRQIQLQINENKRKLQQQKSLFQSKIKRAEEQERQYRIYRYDMEQKCKQYEKGIYRLKSEVQGNLKQFEESKKNLKQIYQRIMDEKIAQINLNFETGLKIKQQQKFQMLLKINQLEDDCNRILIQKELQIQRLREVKDNLNDQVNKCRDQIWQNKIKMENYQKQIKQNQNKIQMLNLNCQCLSKKYEDKVSELTTTIESATLQRKKFLSQIQRNQIQNDKKINILQNEKSNLQAQIISKNNFIEQTKQKIQNSQKFYKNKIKQIQKENENKLNQVMNCLEEEKKLKEQKEKQNQMQKQKHQLEIANIFKNNKQQIQNLNMKHSGKILDLIKQNENKLNQVIINNDHKIAQIRNQNIKFIQQLIYDKEKQKLQKLNQMASKLLQKQNENKLLNQLTKDAQKIMNEQILKIKQQLKKSEQEKQKQSAKYQKQLKQQLNFYQNSLNQTIYQHALKMQKLENQMRSQINMLKQSNSVAQLQQKYHRKLNQIYKQNQQIINRLKFQKEQQFMNIQRERQRQLRLFKQNEENKIKLIQDQWQKKYKSQEENYQKNIQILAKRIEGDLTILNDQLVSQIQSHQITKMSTKEQIQYLGNKIKMIKEELHQKQDKIIDLQLQIAQKKQMLRKIEATIDQKVKQTKQRLENQKQIYFNNCQKNMNETKQKCSIRIKEIQFERLKFSEDLYKQFTQMKQYHQKSFAALQKQYDQLEKLFSQRPSRVQDLTKIKELIEEKSKMSNQMKEYQMQISKANQIVKYLNLELQNYKDVYDIFGPNEGKPEQTYIKQENTYRGQLKPLKNEKNYTEQFMESDIHNRKRKIRKDLSPQIRQLKIFPNLRRNYSIFHQQSEGDDNRQQDIERKIAKRKSLKLDKSSDILSRAEQFMKSLASHKKVTEQSLSNFYYKKSVQRGSKKNRRVYIINGQININKNDNRLQKQ